MTDRVALVTGGLRGLGRAMVLGLAARRASGRRGRAHCGRYRRDRGRGAGARGYRAGLAARRRSARAARMRPGRRRDAAPLRPARHPGQQCRADLYLYRSRPLPPPRGAALLAGVRRDRRERDGDERSGRRPAVAPGRAGHGRAGLGPHRQRDDQARHDEPDRHAPLRRVEGGARNGDRGMGQGRRRHRPDDQHRQPRRRREHAGHGRRDARNEPRGKRPAPRRAGRDGAAAALCRLRGGRGGQRLPL